ncbi:hypothetical protein rosmuc_02266 [Roseovarius mucosus DSM 17069]|uniref:Methyl-accepting chemotaxis protein n=1 Tax=Roseovarius mucosus DSM 17069 TaxID=1288298 RepID=A0A0A0HK22_9RHOB|nr:hypothetical protein [Roseovarius mucosus]KGM87530.1 hypothetical protein rosmuc_02266 [Roseovarius mucosus DSM 17069]
MKSRTGLGARLLAAFLVIAGLPALAGFFGWFELRDVTRAQQQLYDRSIPVLSDMRRFTEESSAIITVAPELAAVDDEAARRDRAAYLGARVAALSDHLSRFQAEHGGGSGGELTRAVVAMEAGIAELDRLVKQRLSLVQARREGLDRALGATQALLNMADTLVANAEMSTAAVISNLYDDEPGQAQHLTTLDKLIEVDLFELGLMFELRSRTAEIGLLFNRIAGLSDAGDLAPIRATLGERTEIVARRVAAIRDPGRAAQAQTLLATILTLSDPAGPGGLLGLTEGILGARWPDRERAGGAAGVGGRVACGGDGSGEPGAGGGAARRGGLARGDPGDAVAQRGCGGCRALAVAGGAVVLRARQYLAAVGQSVGYDDAAGGGAA